jgi:hypothetical protein
MSIGPSIGFEVAKGQENGNTQEVLQTMYPIVASCPVHKDECVTKTPHQDTVAESNVHMDDVQEARLSLINCAPLVSPRDCCVRTKRQQKLPTINPFSVKAGLKDVFVVLEAATPQSMMEFLGDPMGLRI